MGRENKCENRLFSYHKAVNAALGTTLSNLPMFTLWDAKTDRLYSVAAREKVKTNGSRPKELAMPNEVKLLPCPFPHEIKRGSHIECDDEEWDIARGCCGDCGACGPFVDLSDFRGTEEAKEAAAKLWSSRVSEGSRHE